MEPLILIGLLLLAVPLVPIVLSIRTFMRVGRLERSIRDLELQVARLSATAAERKMQEVGETRDARVHEPREPRPVIEAPEVPRVVPEIPQPILAATPARSLQLDHEAPSFRLQTAGTSDDAESLETTIGTRWLLYVGIVAIVIGVAYFEKLAIENGWIGETARVLQGAVVGLALVYVGTRFVRAGYALYGQMISGGGAAILYVSTYAAFNYYHLIDRPVAFVLMVAITAMTAWLADRQQSQGLAVLAVGGGFGTPFLLPGSTDAQIALFGYDAILVGGDDVPRAPPRLAAAEHRQLPVHDADDRGVGGQFLHAARSTSARSCS